MQDLLDDMSGVANTVGAPLAAIAGTTKVFARGVASTVRCHEPERLNLFPTALGSRHYAEHQQLPARIHDASAALCHNGNGFGS